MKSPFGPHTPEACRSVLEPATFLAVSCDGKYAASFPLEVWGGHQLAPPGWYCDLLQRTLGEQCSRPDWFNHKDSFAVGANGCQLGDTCGLFAVNRLLAALESGVVMTLEDMARLAQQRGHAEDDAQGNFEFAILQTALGVHGCNVLPVSREEMSMLTEPGNAGEYPGLFSGAMCGDGASLMLGYLLRTSCFGGHWIALRQHPQEPGSALLCDSMKEAPYRLQAQSMVDLVEAVGMHGALDMQEHAPPVPAEGVRAMSSDDAQQLPDAQIALFQHRAAWSLFRVFR